MNMEKKDLDDLKYAKDLLENPGLAAKLTNILGTPIEKGFELLPEKWSSIVHEATRKSLQKALDFSLKTLGKKRRIKSHTFIHKAAAITSGGVGGAFGLPALAIELPVSTLIMLRSIADIARSEGEDLSQIETKLNCLQVFALGGPSPEDDAAETGYFAIRAALANVITEASKYIAKKGLAEKGAPVLVRLMSIIAARFGLVVSEKVAVMAVPVVGAAGGALVNSIFIFHFQNMARGHFTVRRLERKYSLELVREVYEGISVEPGYQFQQSTPRIDDAPENSSDDEQSKNIAPETDR